MNPDIIKTLSNLVDSIYSKYVGLENNSKTRSIIINDFINNFPLLNNFPIDPNNQLCIDVLYKYISDNQNRIIQDHRKKLILSIINK